MWIKILGRKHLLFWVRTLLIVPNYLLIYLFIDQNNVLSPIHTTLFLLFPLWGWTSRSLHCSSITTSPSEHHGHFFLSRTKDSYYNTATTAKATSPNEVILGEIIHTHIIVRNKNITISIKAVVHSITEYHYEPGAKLTFRTWFLQFKGHFQVEFKKLVDDWKIRLLLRKFKSSEHYALT